MEFTQKTYMKFPTFSMILSLTFLILLMPSVCASFKIRYVLQKAILYINTPRDG